MKAMRLNARCSYDDSCYWFTHASFGWRFSDSNNSEVYETNLLCVWIPKSKYNLFVYCLNKVGCEKSYTIRWGIHHLKIVVLDGSVLGWAYVTPKSKSNE